MTQDDIPMWEDPQESSAMRQLLRAGRVENSDYNVEQGLARHLAQLSAGTPMPEWAVQTTLQKSASWSVLAWLVPPMISAGVVGTWLALRPADPPPATLLPPAPPVAAATVQAVQAPSLAEQAAVLEPTPRVAALSGVSQERDARDVRDATEPQERHGALARSARPVVSRAVAVRRGRERGTRIGADESASYATAAQSTSYDTAGVGSGGGLSAGVATSAASASANIASKNANDAAEQAAKPEPAPAPAEEAAKPKERRAKDEEAAKVDEVTGARLEREMRMLAVAQRVLTEDPERSLRLCRQGESEFRGSMFSAERKQVALLALVQLGKVEQARREGIPFLRAYPNAPWSARLREALSKGRLPANP
jgi:hypothetical protein